MIVIKSLRSLKQGTRFISYGKDDVEQVCIARTRRGAQRDIEIEGREGTYNMHGDIKVEVLTKLRTVEQR